MVSFPGAKIPFNMPPRFRMTSVMVREDLNCEKVDRAFHGVSSFILKSENPVAGGSIDGHSTATQSNQLPGKRWQANGGQYKTISLDCGD
ncbi:hypothetical protein IQ250_22090 [Pseudanabaenaceae cyanobacterium LEGE 13415]|nr:hypothetical protein [Pseudanabaenaceae cyanobacterium LEGE 13415]